MKKTPFWSLSPKVNNDKRKDYFRLKRITALMLFAVTAEGVVTFTTWIAAVDTTENRKFLRNYRAEYDDQEPDAFAALSRPSVYILAQAIADASSTVTHLLGEFHFDCNGDAVYEPVVARVRDGRFEVFRQ